MPAELMSPIPPRIKKKRRVIPARTKAAFKKTETILLIPVGLCKAPGPELPKKASPIEKASSFTTPF